MRFLYITSHYSPFSSQTGSEQRYNLLLNALVRIGDVDLITFRAGVKSNIENCSVIFSEDIPKLRTQGRINDLKKLQRPFKIESFFPINKARAEIVDSLISQKEYDLIVTRYIWAALECDLMRYADRLVVDVDDHPVDTWMALSHNAESAGRRVYYRICAFFIKKMIPNLLNSIRFSFFANQDQVFYRHSAYLPNIPFYQMSAILPKKQFTTTLLFVGDLRYPPNYLGIEHFVTHVFPKIRQTIPSVRLNIVGRNNGAEWEQRIQQTPGVSVKGYVQDLQKEYENSDVCVVPVYSGAGTNIKVLEAMQANRSCVVSEEATRGFRNVFIEGKDYLVSRNDREFVDNVCSLLANDSYNISISNNGNDTVRKLFSREVFYRAVEQMLE